MVKTLIDQATLVPLPAHVAPVYSDYGHALGLYPIPDVLILADKFDWYNLTYEVRTSGCRSSHRVLSYRVARKPTIKSSQGTAL